MVYYPAELIDRWITDSMTHGDLSTRLLNITGKNGGIRFLLEKAGRISGTDAAEKILRRFDLVITSKAVDGMNDGTISGNTIAGGGVSVSICGTFAMNDGIISGNTASSGGGVSGGTFAKSGRGGIIYGINAEEQANRATSGNGHAVYVSSSKKRDNTARATTAMDSTKSGLAGGWD